MPEQISQPEVSDDVKQFLRSILISKKGVKQSKIEHDYRELVGESLPWRRLRFQNLFEFLMAVPDVAKLEWREKDEENRVFAVLDKNAFASLHAKRMAERGFGQGSKPLSPAEIVEWKARKRGGKIHHSSSAPAMMKTTDTKSRNDSPLIIPAELMKSKTVTQNPVFKTPAMIKATETNSRNESPLIISAGLRNNKTITQNQGSIKVTFQNNEVSTKNDLNANLLSKYEDNLFPNLDGLYCLCIQIDQTGIMSAPSEMELKQIIRAHFSLPGCSIQEINIMPSGTMVFVRYRSKLEAAYTIQMTHKTETRGMKFNVTPAVERTKKQEEKSLHRASLSTLSDDRHFPQNSPTLPAPETCSQNSALLPTPRIGFQSSALLPTPQAAYIFVQPVTVSKPNIKANSSQLNGNHLQNDTSPLTSDFSCSKDFKDEEPSADSYSFAKPTVQTELSEPLPPSKSFDQREEKENYIISPDAEGSTPKKHQVEKSEHDNWFDYDTMEKMFQMSCRKKPKFADDLPDHITFIVTFALDACRFWIQNSEYEESCRKLNCKLRQEIAKEEARAQVFPNKYHFGAAKFKEDEMWYRCWVLESNKAKNEIRVYFCDYGNIEVIPGENFTHINQSYWVLPPQGIPAKLHGLKRREDTSDTKIRQEAELLGKLCTGKLIEAEVVKQGSSLQPHILELRNLVVPDIESEFLEDILVQDGILLRTERENITKVPEKHHVPEFSNFSSLKHCPSLYNFNPEHLTKIQVLTVESPHSFYIKTQASNELLAEITQRLASFSSEEKATPTIGSKVCLKDDYGVKRVKVMDLACNFMYSKRVLVVDIDSGQKIWAQADDLYVLDDELRNLKEVATSAALAGIATKNRVTNATAMVRERIGKDSYVNIIGESSTGKLIVELFRGDMSGSINAEVIQHGLAKIVRTGPYGVPKEVRTPQKINQDKKAPDCRRSSNSRTEPLSPKVKNINGGFGAPQQPRSKVPWMTNGKKSPQRTNAAQNQTSPLGRPESLHSRRSTSSVSSDGSISDETMLDNSVKFRPFPFRNGGPQGRKEKRSNNVEYLDCQGSYGSSSSLADDSFSEREPSPASFSQINTRNAQLDIKIRPTEPRPIFRPHTPPTLPPPTLPPPILPPPTLPPLIDIESPSKEMTSSERIVSMIRAAAKSNGLSDFISVRPDGTLDREAIKHEICRWNSCKMVLERYQQTLKEVWNMPENKSGTHLIKNRRKRLELLVKTSESEKQLAELEAELNDLKNELSKQS